MSGPYRDRMFAAAEVRRILRAASELEDDKRPPRDAGRPHTLEEIEQIARDAGIGDEAIRRAVAGEVPPPRGPRRPFSFAGAPGRISVERTVSGKATATIHGKLAKTMRGAIGQIGSAQALGDTLTWSTAPTPSGAGRNVYAIVEPEDDGRVTVRVEENLGSLRGGLFGGILGGVGGGGLGLVIPLIVAISPALVPFALCAWILGIYLLVRALYANRFRAREAEIQGLVDHVAGIVEGPSRRVAAGVEPIATRVAEARAEEEAAEDDERVEPARRAEK